MATRIRKILENASQQRSRGSRVKHGPSQLRALHLGASSNDGMQEPLPVITMSQTSTGLGEQRESHFSKATQLVSGRAKISVQV